MSPEKFLALTIPEQLLAIYERLEQKPATQNGTGDGRAPRFDTAIHVGKGKVCYASDAEPPSTGAGGGDDDIPFARRNDP